MGSHEKLYQRPHILDAVGGLNGEAGDAFMPLRVEDVMRGRGTNSRTPPRPSDRPRV